MSGDYIIHEGVTYHLAEDLPPLRDHVETCPGCDGSGQMYGRNCKGCRGRGLLFLPFLVDKPRSSDGGHTEESEPQ